jgi:hypothetical protein
MTRGPSITTGINQIEIQNRVSGVSKFRKCLTCREDFQSEWAGQRVCTKCKKKAKWRSGALRQCF